jgi:uncharacterized protein (DUF1800 family)
MSAMDTFQGTGGKLDAKSAEHLLRRTMFGATRAHIKTLTGKTVQEAVEMLLADQAAPAPPVNPNNGAQWVTGTRDATINDNQYYNWFRAWWIGLMVTQQISVREKLTLFWQNHFVSTNSTVNNAQFMYLQNALLRRNAMGNFRTFLREITIDPAMLRYLNGNTNRLGSAQENYARELQELFTIGKGAERAPFDYTNYTEADVRAAARVLTGWTENAAMLAGVFTLGRHDTSDKQFSAAYQNTVIKGRNTATAGMDELNDLLTMILKQAETARYIVRKFYRYFVNFDITPTIETTVIEPLAKIFRDGNYEIKPVLRALFRSEHFFSTEVRGAIIKTPLDFILGAARQFEGTMPAESTQRVAYYNLMNTLRVSAQGLQQDIHEQPNVAGWSAYYQEPLYYQMWANTATMPARRTLGNVPAATNPANGIIAGYNVNTAATGAAAVAQRFLAIDVVEYVRAFPNPSDPAALIESLNENFFAVDLTAAQRSYLISSVLMPGVPDYEWTTQWNDFIKDMSTTKRAAIRTRLNNLMSYMLQMAEYQIY